MRALKTASVVNAFYRRRSKIRESEIRFAGERNKKKSNLPSFLPSHLYLFSHSRFLSRTDTRIGTQTFIPTLQSPASPITRGRSGNPFLHSKETQSIYTKIAPLLTSTSVKEYQKDNHNKVATTRIPIPRQFYVSFTRDLSVIVGTSQPRTSPTLPPRRSRDEGPSNLRRYGG